MTIPSKGADIMKNIISLLILLTIFASFCNGQPVQGDSLIIDGKLVLRVWGTHYERGYASGFLMADRNKDLFDNYIVGSMFGGSAVNYAAARAWFESNFDIELKYQQEAEGMFQGMTDSGVSLYNSVLGRDLDVTDVLMSTALVELWFLDSFGMQMNIGCSNVSSWGNSTLLDPELNGSLVVTRQFDWDMHPSFLANQMMIVNFPSETDEVAWVNIGVAGNIAPMSAVNELGLGAFHDNGNYNINPNPGPFHPLFLSMRNGIEMDDYNGDLLNDPYDVAQAIQDELHFGPRIVTAVCPDEGIVIECNNALGVAIRTEEDNTVIPMNNIVATNHFRLLYTPTYCSRYEAIADSLNANANVTVDRSWDILCGAAGVAWNVQTIGFAPTIDLAKLSTATTSGAPAYTQPPTFFNLASLFAPPQVTVDLTYISGSPVPASGGNLIFDTFVLNQDSVALNFDAWLEISYEGGTPTTVVMRSLTNYQPGWTINRPRMYFPIPETYAAGNYAFTGKVGFNPNVAWDEDSFPFSKEGTNFVDGFVPYAVNGAPDPFDRIDEGAATVESPSTYSLEDAYPNPFNPTTTIRYAIPEAAKITLTIYDIQGRQVAELVNGFRQAGSHEVTFDASQLASGVYLYRLSTPGFTAISKMTLLK